MAGITGFKVALCLSYLRILSKSHKLYQKVVWAVLITCVLSHAAGTLVLIFQCKPVRPSLHRPRSSSVDSYRSEDHGYPPHLDPAFLTTRHSTAWRPSPSSSTASSSFSPSPSSHSCRSTGAARSASSSSSCSASSRRSAPSCAWCRSSRSPRPGTPPCWSSGGPSR